MPRATERASTTSGVRAVDRAIAVLQAFDADHPSPSVIEIQQRTGLNRPTVYRMLETLARHGLVRAHGTPQRFSLDYGVGQLAQRWLAGLDPVAAARPVIDRLHEETKETVSLALLQGHRLIYALERPSPHVLSISRGIGPMEHMGRGAGGKAILAFMSDRDREIVLQAPDRGIDRKALATDLAAVRRQGHAVARSEIISGAVSIAAPFFDQAGAVAGSIVVFGPEVRLGPERIRVLLRTVSKAAAEVSIAMGHEASRQAR